MSKYAITINKAADLFYTSPAKLHILVVDLLFQDRFISKPQYDAWISKHHR